MSRILVWSPNYAPELTGIPPLVTDACSWLAARGHEVEVVTALPNYPRRRIDPAYRGSLWRSEVLDGIPVHRSWLRVRPGESFVDKALYEASFTALSLPRVIRRVRQADVLVCVVPAAAASVAEFMSNLLVYPAFTVLPSGCHREERRPYETLDFGGATRAPHESAL